MSKVPTSTDSGKQEATTPRRRRVITPPDGAAAWGYDEPIPYWPAAEIARAEHELLQP